MNGNGDRLALFEMVRTKAVCYALPLATAILLLPCCYHCADKVLGESFAMSPQQDREGNKNDYPVLYW